MSSNGNLSRLLQSIHDTYPNIVEPHILSSILPSILLALVARNTNVVFTTSNGVELQKSTAKVLSTVFGLQTKRIRIRSLQSPHDLLMSLFVSSSPASSSTSSHKRRPSQSNMSRSYSAPRPASSHFTEGSDSTAPPPASSRLPRYKTDPLPRESDAQAILHLPQAIVIFGLERASRKAQLALGEVLRTRRVFLESGEDGGSVWNLPSEFFVVFISKLGDGHERPAIHPTLLDHFAFSVTPTPNPVAATTSSPSSRLRPLPPSPLPRRPPLLPLDQIPHPDTSAIAPLVSHYTTALFSAVRHHPEFDGTLLTARCVRDVEALVHASAVIFRESEELSIITEAHVRRIVPLALAHRLRVRDGPREQVMGILWQGAGVRRWGESEDAQDNRRSIKAILTEIIAEI